MANKIMKFISKTFGSVRGLYLDGQPWLYAKDVCKILNVGRVEKALARLDDDEWLVLESTPPVSHNKGKGGVIKKTWLVNEFGFYSLVLTGRTPEAKKFKRWVTHEVLPTIRRTGEYRIVWDEARSGGKTTRRKLTDTIKTFAGYVEATSETRRDVGTWIIIFSNKINKAVGASGERDEMTAKQLFEIDTCEDMCARAIEEGMAAQKEYHEILGACNEKLDEWQRLTK